MIRATIGILAGQGGAALLLDDYSGAAAAYSLRLLSSTYTGDAIEVRRSSDNTTQDIGFVDNELDTTSLLSFVGTGGTDNGFVTTWYDQSGNGNDTTQTTDANQPQIVSSGSVITENGKPSIDFDGSNDSLYGESLNFSAFTDLSFFFVHKTDISPNSDDNLTLQYRYDGTNMVAFGMRSGYYTRISQGNQRNGFFTTLTNQALISNIIDYTNLSNDFYYNDSLKTDVNSNARREDGVTHPSIIIGNRQLIELPFDGNIQEVIFYPSDQSSNRTGIETNINSHYNIY